MIERQDQEFRAHLSKTDVEFHRLIAPHPPLPPFERRRPLDAMVRIVAGQQLSVKAAQSVCQRLEQLCGGTIDAMSLSKQPWEAIRACGLSAAKTHCVLALVEFSGSDEKALQELVLCEWEEVRNTLLAIKGIGPWSVDMFGMVGLRMPDLFASGDLGLRMAMVECLGVPANAKPATLEARALKWSPYRTLASRHLWLALDRKRQPR